jgi:hypothetical protein
MRVDMVPSGNRARELSRWLSRLFATCLYMGPAALAALSIAFVLLYDQVHAALVDQGLSHAAPPFLSIPQRLLLVATVAVYCTPTLITVRYLRELFASFAEGAVFTAHNVRRLRGIGNWLLISLVTANVSQAVFLVVSRHPQPDMNLTLLPALYAAMIYVVAYVLEEANRIVDDNSRFV